MLSNYGAEDSWEFLGQFSPVQFSHSVVSDSLQPHGLQDARSPCPSPTPGVYSNSCPLSQWYHPNHLILCRPLLLPPSIIPSIRVFSNESVFCIRWPNYWSFSFSISPSNDYLGLISFRVDWLDLLAGRSRDLCFILQMYSKCLRSSLHIVGAQFMFLEWIASSRVTENT